MRAKMKNPTTATPMASPAEPMSMETTSSRTPYAPEGRVVPPPRSTPTRGGRDRRRAPPVSPRRRIADQHATLDVGDDHVVPGAMRVPGKMAGRTTPHPGPGPTRAVRACELLGHHRGLAHHARDTVQHRRLLFPASGRLHGPVPGSTPRWRPSTRTIRDRPVPLPGPHRGAAPSARPLPGGAARARPRVTVGHAPPAPSPVAPLTARKTWRTVEPLHGMVYFAPEAADSYARLGLERPVRLLRLPVGPAWARSAAGTVVATFFNFRPRWSARPWTGVWRSTTPAEVLEPPARPPPPPPSGGCSAAPPTRTGCARAADLARRAALRACEHTEGRPLFAGHADLPGRTDHSESCGTPRPCCASSAATATSPCWSTTGSTASRHSCSTRRPESSPWSCFAAPGAGPTTSGRRHRAPARAGLGPPGRVRRSTWR